MINATKIVQALQCDNTACGCHRESLLADGVGYTLHCPAHDDAHPSLSFSIREGKILVYCHAGCSQEKVIQVLRERSMNIPPPPSVGGAQVRKSPEGLTLAELAQAKKLPVEFLRAQGIADWTRNGRRRVRIPYLDAEGRTLATRYRLGVANESSRFIWKSGDHPTLYGLHRLTEIRKAAWVLLVEGESDAWTLWFHNLPALGIPGKSTWRAEWAEHLRGLTVYLWQEPEAEDLTDRVSATLANLRVIAAPRGIKDPSEAHLLGGYDIPKFIDALKANAKTAEAIRSDRVSSQLAELEAQCTPVLYSDDPLRLVEDEIRRLGYGGNTQPPMIVYLAATSRVLAMRHGAMPVHLLLLGVPSTGKSWTISTVLRLFPPSAHHTIDAGSPRVLIYDNTDLRHRVVVFTESDSLPSGEDNPASSAVRNLLQEGCLKYQVVLSDPQTGDHITREINRPGPTVLFTTAVHSLGDQLMTRLFTLELPDDPAQFRAALASQAQLELGDAHEPSPELVAYQELLQRCAPWGVFVPFASELSEAVGRSAIANRILRDYARLLSLVKTVAVLRHRHRRSDSSGRLIAELEDYATVRDLVNDMYRDSVSGASARVREIVGVVAKLAAQSDAGETKITANRIAKELTLHHSGVLRAVRTAIKNGWLVNREERRKYPYDLAVGEPLPDDCGLPTVDTLRTMSLRGA